MTAKTTSKKRGRPKKSPEILKHDDSEAIAEKFDNTILFDVYCISNHPEVKVFVDVIYNQMRDEGLVPNQSKYARRLRDHVLITLLNLCLAYFSDPNKYVAYHRNKNAYAKGSRYHTLLFSYHNLVQKVIQFLIDHQYIENKKGHRFADSKKISRMRATDKLIKLADNVSPVMIQHDIPDDRLLILKNEDKEDIPYSDTAETLKMKENLKFINNLFKREAILLEITDKELQLLNDRLNDHPDLERRRGGSIDFTKTQLHRTFNNSSWEQGGRFYGGWWQRIPREYREFIKINDKDVVELDYSGLHVNMLYAMEKLPMPEGDVYYLDGYSNDEKFRKLVKQMLLIMVNCSDREAARKAIHKAVHYDKTLKIPDDIKSTKGDDLFELMAAFCEKHEPIKDYFNSGKGIDLQYLDSIIAEQVMVHFAKMGYPCLPLHDSFIVHHGLEAELNEEMNKAFKDLFNVDAKIYLKYRSIDNRQEREDLEREKKGISPDDVDALFYKESIDERWASDDEYSRYWNMLEQYRKYQNVAQ